MSAGRPSTVSTVLMANLETARKARGLTQTQVGAAVGRTWRTVYNWESGAVTPSVEMVEALARVFRVRMERLFFEPTEDFKASFQENVSCASL